MYPLRSKCNGLPTPFKILCRAFKLLHILCGEFSILRVSAIMCPRHRECTRMQPLRGGCANIYTFSRVFASLDLPCGAFVSSFVEYSQSFVHHLEYLPFACTPQSKHVYSLQNGWKHTFSLWSIFNVVWSPWNICHDVSTQLGKCCIFASSHMLHGPFISWQVVCGVCAKINILLRIYAHTLEYMPMLQCTIICSTVPALTPDHVQLIWSN